MAHFLSLCHSWKLLQKVQEATSFKDTSYAIMSADTEVRKLPCLMTQWHLCAAHRIDDRDADDVAAPSAQQGPLLSM